MMQGIVVDTAPLVGLEGKSVAHTRDFLHKLKIRTIIRHVVEKNQPKKEADNSTEAGLDEANGHFFVFITGGCLKSLEGIKKNPRYKSVGDFCLFL